MSCHIDVTMLLAFRSGYHAQVAQTIVTIESLKFDLRSKSYRVSHVFVPFDKFPSLKFMGHR